MLPGVNGTAASVAFVFPLASGHTNPSLPVARQLVARGIPVHYLSYPSLREAVEDTGASFHNTVEWQPELMTEGPTDDIFRARTRLIESLPQKLPTDVPPMVKLTLMKEIILLRTVPGTIRFLRHVKASAVVYCPLLNPEAPVAARYLGLPCISLLTTAGPGSIVQLVPEGSHQVEALRQHQSTFKPHADAVAELNETYGLDLPLPDQDVVQPPVLHYYSRHANLVTTVEALADECPDHVAAKYEAAGVTFDFVGPLMDGAGAARCGAGVNSTAAAASDDNSETQESTDLLEAVRDAKASGRKVVYASLGTVITGDYSQMGEGWKGRGPDGHSISGKELCQSAWGGVFDTFGEREEWLIVCSIGCQPDALEGVKVPSNAICSPHVPQVDLLPHVDVFLTHGGQNSFMEAMSNGIPLVVCPGFADQPVNAAKAERLGVGLKVDRPEVGDNAEAVAAYRAGVVQALRRVAGEASFAEEAKSFVGMIGGAGGVKAAVQTVVRLMSARKI